jgi:hypothetical protein
MSGRQSKPSRRTLQLAKAGQRRAFCLLTLSGLCALASAGPALAVAPEAPVTEAASGVTVGGATLHGKLNPNISATTGHQFTYGAGGSCEGAATEVTLPGEEPTGKGLPVETTLSGLEPHREYTFCVVATHWEGEALEATSGAPLHFTTKSSAPATEALAASHVTPFAATLEAQVNPQNEVTTCTFEYGALAVSENTAPCEQGGGTLEGFGSQPASISVTGLAQATTYHFRVTARNATGETQPEGEFTTLAAEKPAVAGESVSGLTSTDVMLEAKVNPNYQETTYSFEYSTSASMTGAATVGEGSLPAVSEELAAGPADTGGALQPATTYFYRLVATNGTGVTDGPVQQFRTLDTPVVTTGGAQGMTRSTVTLTGTVNPEGAETAYHFLYIEQSGYEAGVASNPSEPYAKGQITPSKAVPAGAQTVPAALVIANLRPGTTYHYALVATNSVGSVTGAGQATTTLPSTPPATFTGGAAGVGQTAATLTGVVEPQGLPTTYSFELGSTPSALLQVAVGDASGGNVSATLSGLIPGTTYYYRLTATNEDGSSAGAQASFATTAVPNTAPTVFQGFLTLDGIAPLPGPKIVGSSPAKPLTKAQRLAKALKVCRKDKQKGKRQACEKQARGRYGTIKKGNTEKDAHKAGH